MKRKLDVSNIYGQSSSGAGSSYSSSDPSINPFTGRPYSSKYYEILSKRQQLPVYEFKDDLIDKVKNNQTIVVEGETGSGKLWYLLSLSLSSSKQRALNDSPIRLSLSK